MNGSILVAATNQVGLLDRAMFRRFDVIVPFDNPTREQAEALLKLRLANLGPGEDQAVRLSEYVEGYSFADLARASDDAVRTMALDDRQEPGCRISSRSTRLLLISGCCWTIPDQSP